MRRLGMLVGSMVTLGAFVAACSSASSGGGNAGSGGGAAASGSGGFGGFNTGGSGNVNLDGGGGTGNTSSCATATFDGELSPLDLFLMLDKSGSMDSSQNNTWGPVTNAISQFVSLPNLTKLGMGFGLFPTPPATPAAKGPCASNNDCGFYECTPIFNTCSGALSPNDSCIATDYQTPVVPMADLPGVGSAIKSAMSSASPDGSSTTLTPALEGAIDLRHNLGAVPHRSHRGRGAGHRRRAQQLLQQLRDRSGSHRERGLRAESQYPHLRGRHGQPLHPRRHRVQRRHGQGHPGEHRQCRAGVPRRAEQDSRRGGLPIPIPTGAKADPTR